MITTGKELAAAAMNAAENFKTLYVMGCIGAPLNDKNKDRYSRNYSYNRQTERTVKIKSATSDTFGFDCVCLVKSLLWGWQGDKNKTYGGAVYESNGVPDINEKAMLNACTDVSTDFSNIQEGEFLWVSGHCGIYVGDGLAVECSPAWADGVQITAVRNIYDKGGYNARTWTKHGKLPYVTYEAPVKTVDISLPQIAKGSKGEAVQALQRLLSTYGYSLGTKNPFDGDFGTKTDTAVRAYQKENGLEVDGIVGVKTWAKLLGGDG